MGASTELGYNEEQAAELEANVAFYRGEGEVVAEGEEAFTEEQTQEWYASLCQMTPEELDKHLLEEMGYTEDQKQEVLQQVEAFKQEAEAQAAEADAEACETDEKQVEDVDAGGEKRAAEAAEEEPAAKVAKEA